MSDNKRIDRVVNVNALGIDGTISCLLVTFDMDEALGLFQKLKAPTSDKYASVSLQSRKGCQKRWHFDPPAAKPVGSDASASSSQDAARTDTGAAAPTSDAPASPHAEKAHKKGSKKS